MDILTSVLPLVLLILVNLAVIFRRIGRLNIPAWTAFMAAAVILILLEPGMYERAVLIVGRQAGVLVFLFGMFVIVTALEISGVLENGAKIILSRARTGQGLLLWVHLGFGLAAAFLINDTVAILGPVILIVYAKQVGKDARPFILAVAFGLTFGSALLPTGNPQNFILASAGKISFIEFAVWALIPTFIALIGSFFTLRFMYRPVFNQKPLPAASMIFEKHEFQHLAKPSILALIAMLSGMLVSSLFNIPVAVIILVITGVFLFFINDRDQILSRLDWGVLFFFAGMFIVIDAVTSSEIFTMLIDPLLNNLGIDFSSYIFFVLIIFIASQLLSNVPVAILISQILQGSLLDHPLFWMAAALTTTFAGATTVLGAASNIIVIETSSKRGIRLTWLEFAKIGIPTSLISLTGVFLLGGVYFFLF
ncbi:MAG: SLC13 family permease [Candidatus Odinarchaeota archaeon]